MQLPGVQDTVRAKEILGATATLEFRMVHGSFTDWNAAATSGRAPIGSRLYTQSNGDPVLLYPVFHIIPCGRFVDGRVLPRLEVCTLA